MPLLPLPKVSALSPVIQGKKKPLVPWERPIISVIKGSAGMMDSLARPVARSSDSMIQIASRPAPPPLQGARGWKEALGRAWQVLNTPSHKLEQQARTQSPNLARQVMPLVRPVNKASRKILQETGEVRRKLSHYDTGLAGAAVEKAIESAPALLLSGPTTRMKVANGVVNAAIAYGKDGMVPAAIASGLVRGNSTGTNALEEAATEVLDLPFGGFRAHGGPVRPGMSYVVGEKGPELFTPNTPGTIVPHSPQNRGYAPGSLAARPTVKKGGVRMRDESPEAFRARMDANQAQPTATTSSPAPLIPTAVAPTRRDNILAARAAGTFDAKRAAYNQAGLATGHSMDEAGNITGPSAAGSNTPRPQASTFASATDGQGGSKMVRLPDTPPAPTTPRHTTGPANPTGIPAFDSLTQEVSRPPPSRDLYAEEKQRQTTETTGPTSAQLTALGKAHQIANSRSTADIMAKAQSLLAPTPRASARRQPFKPQALATRPTAQKSQLTILR